MNDADKQLIELAARAYGLNVHGWIGDQMSWHDPITGWNGHGDWSPLENDGDAFRVMTMLSIDIEFCMLAVNAHYHDKNGLWFKTENHEHGTCAEATRRAITRAAAEIGRGMK